MQDDPDRPNVVILPTDLDYLDDLVKVQREAYNLTPDEYDHPEIMQAYKYESHLRVFPDGQFMALEAFEDKVVGACVSQIIDHDLAQPVTHAWAKATNYGTISTHNPQGEWLYGVDNVVLASYRGQGIGGKLMRARYNVARRFNLRGMIAGSMPIDYYKAAAEGVDIHTYVEEVVAGLRWDSNLSKQLKTGCQVLNVIPNYLSDSEDTLNYGVAIVWHNPDYRSPKSLPKRPRPAKRTSIQPGTSA
jgi:GNAT superfamily N-acetyltransferase